MCKIALFLHRLPRNNKKPQREEATITLENELEMGLGGAKLIIEYVGVLNDKMKGFYRSKYKRSNGDPAYAGTTQFEAAGAFSFSIDKRATAVFLSPLPTRGSPLGHV